MIVCDGFLGNVVLKMLEGVGRPALVDRGGIRPVQWRIGLQMLGNGLDRIKELTDWKVYGARRCWASTMR